MFDSKVKSGSIQHNTHASTSNQSLARISSSPCTAQYTARNEMYQWAGWLKWTTWTIGTIYALAGMRNIHMCENSIAGIKWRHVKTFPAIFQLSTHRTFHYIPKIRVALEEVSGDLFTTLHEGQGHISFWWMYHWGRDSLRTSVVPSTSFHHCAFLGGFDVSCVSMNRLLFIQFTRKISL